MPTNQYLPWDTAGGATVYDFATYTALTARAGGAVPGVADPIAFNTAMRQASVAAAGIGQFIVDLVGSSLLDDGNPLTYENAFAAAFGIKVASILAAGAPIRSAKTTVTISGTTANIDFSLGNYFVILLNANLVTLTFSNFPPSGVEQEITVDFVVDGTDHGHTFLAESLLKWLGIGAAGAAPTFAYTPSGTVNTVVFKVRDGVTTRVEAAYSGTSAP